MEKKRFNQKEATNKRGNERRRSWTQKNEAGDWTEHTENSYKDGAWSEQFNCDAASWGTREEAEKAQNERWETYMENGWS